MPLENKTNFIIHSLFTTNESYIWLMIHSWGKTNDIHTLFNITAGSPVTCQQMFNLHHLDLNICNGYELDAKLIRRIPDLILGTELLWGIKNYCEEYNLLWGI